KDQKLHLIDLNMNLLNGSLIANGTYSKLKNKPAHSFFGLKISNFSISEAFQNFLMVQKFVPIAKNIQGNFGGDIELVTDLDSTLTPVFRSLNSRGSLIIQKALVENFKPLDVVADILKMEKLKKLSIENFTPSYTIQDGRLNLAPLDFKSENIEFMVAGSNGIDMTMDYLMKLKFPAGELTDRSNTVINNLFNKKVDLLQDDHVILDVSLKGTISKPDVNVSGKDILKGATDKLTDIAKQEIQKQEAILADTVKTEIDKQKSQLEELRKEAEAKAKSEQERLKKEAEQKLKDLFKKK
ncbi:MAG: AsmA-like C-terminal region-containing protein, partial [bacterium]|nr:AsmA-like C-terminal region-containing protein [bacterium]